jgi:hypothetical protein|tara:strand:- start:183 stop:470 length:288 start_codon:yes stop_codon:yes gene_type:complete
MAMKARKKVTMDELRERISERDLLKLSIGFNLDAETIKQLREGEEVSPSMGHYNTQEYMGGLEGVSLILGEDSEFNYSECGKRPKIHRNENYVEA